MITALQILNDEIKSKIIPSSKENGDLTDYQYGHNVAYGVVLTLIEYLLEKEKEQPMPHAKNDKPIGRLLTLYKELGDFNSVELSFQDGGKI